MGLIQDGAVGTLGLWFWKGIHNDWRIVLFKGVENSRRSGGISRLSPASRRQATRQAHTHMETAPRCLGCLIQDTYWGAGHGPLIRIYFTSWFLVACHQWFLPQTSISAFQELLESNLLVWPRISLRPILCWVPILPKMKARGAPRPH